MRKRHYRLENEATEKEDKIPRPILKDETLVGGLFEAPNQSGIGFCSLLSNMIDTAVQNTRYSFPK
jgi:hypothetical protein